jgi:pimeloyl-ACP methyl ester carboxylesterase
MAPIVMVHGAFCAGWAFDQFRLPFEARGLEVYAPDLPGHSDAARVGDVAGLSMRDFCDALTGACKSLSEPPILIGHSLGGLVVQMAAARMPVRALILLAPSAPWGVSGATVEEGLSALSLYGLGPFWLQAVDPVYSVAKDYLFNLMPPEAVTPLFQRMTPESGRALWETLNWWLDPLATTLVSPGAVRAPVLAIAGEKDVIHPPATVTETARRLNGEVRVFPGMGHWLVGESGWPNVAQCCLDWLSAAEPSQAA